MVKHSKGFTILELIITLSFLTILSLISLTKWQFDAHNNKNIDVVALQVEAMHRQERIFVHDSLSFNSNGNINHAQTVHFNNKICVFQLGFGRFYCE